MTLVSPIQGFTYQLEVPRRTHLSNGHTYQMDSPMRTGPKRALENPPRMVPEHLSFRVSLRGILGSFRSSPIRLSI